MDCPPNSRLAGPDLSGSMRLCGGGNTSSSGRSEVFSSLHPSSDGASLSAKSQGSVEWDARACAVGRRDARALLLPGKVTLSAQW